MQFRPFFLFAGQAEGTGAYDFSDQKNACSMMKRVLLILLPAIFSWA